MGKKIQKRFYELDDKGVNFFSNKLVFLKSTTARIEPKSALSFPKGRKDLIKGDSPLLRYHND